jgi:ABC-type Zn uptake system ZnuABC Zn-binding protein ZnuA
MQYPIVFLLTSLMFMVPLYGIAVQPLSSPVQSGARCEQPSTAGEEVVVGRYPLHAIVTMIDYENATVDFITEVGTSLHVTQASASELERFQIGDTVEICISEALHGEAEV